MIISANGIVINEYGDVLLVQRDDTRTLAPPGGACEIDEIPKHAAAREVREETGLLVYPIRLVGLYFLPAQPNPFLFLCYRCIPRGGKLSNSAETPQADFFKTTPQPGPMLAFHEKQIRDAFKHTGGPPYWMDHQVDLKMRAGLFLLNRVIYPWLGFRRSRLGLPEYVPPPLWQVRATLLLRNSKGEFLLLEDKNTDSWKLPSSTLSSTEPPWTKANQFIQTYLDNNAVLENLSGIYLSQGKSEMEFVFSGAVVEKAFLHQGLTSAFFETGFWPSTLAPDHQTMIQDSLDLSAQITHKVLD